MNFVGINNISKYLDKCYQDHGVKIRKAERSDCSDLAKLIQGLAEFEKMPGGAKLDITALEKDGFETTPPLFFCLVAEAPSPDKHLIGYALYYFAYSTWNGKVMFLEDLFCSPDYRSKKVGSSLFRAVCKEALYAGCKRMDFHVLGWNPARKFYEQHGAVDISEEETWHVYRMREPALNAIE